MPLLRTVGRFYNIYEANIACSALRANGIDALLCDENLARIDWGVTNAMGGMRLQVKEEDAVDAIALLNMWAADQGQQEAETF